MGEKEKFLTSKYGIIFGYRFEGCKCGASEDVWFLGLFFPTPGPVLGPRLNEVGLWVEKKSSPLTNMESYLDTHLRVAPVVLIASENIWFLGRFFPTTGPRFERSGIMGGKEKFPISKYGIIFGYPFEGCTHGNDCERRCVVLGTLFLNSEPHSRYTFERSGIMGGKAKFPASKYGIIFGYPF
jgi:hypothetical protein